MSIFEDFYRLEHYIGNRQTRKKYPKAYRLWRNRSIKFLEYCDNKNVYRIGNIKKEHYNGFIAHISINKSPTTIRDWKYALQEFFERAHLDISVQTSPQKQSAKRRSRAYKRLRKGFDDPTVKTILDMLKGLI